jgi:outer membrane protein OmpA-like peptidoglycan-associated protein
MKRVIILLLLIVFSVQFFEAQAKTYSLSLFYDINESQAPGHLKRLDSLLKETGTTQKQIKLFAYTDFLADTDFNIRLSQKRLALVKNYIQSKEGENAVFVETKAYGEKYSSDNQSIDGEPSQRRVDVFISAQEERKKISKNPLETQTKKEKPSKKTEVPKETTQLQKNISELKEGESLTIDGLSFIPGRHILMKSSIPVLEELLSTLKEKEDLRIEIQGHICCLTSNEADGLDLDTGEPKLSENRALAVYNYLIKNGIDADRLNYKGYGHRFPKVIEQTLEDEQINRRVEIKVLEN